MKNVVAQSLILILSIGLYACKKKDKSPNPTPEPTPIVEGTRALFNSYKTCMVTGSVITYTWDTGEAFLCNQDLMYDLIPFSNSYIDMGTVSMNGKTFKKNAYGQSNRHIDTTGNLGNPVPQIWQISGSSNLSGFTYTNNSNYPTYTGYTAIADSFVISSGINIPLNNYSGADAIFVNLFNPSGGNGSATKTIEGNASSIVYTASELSSIGTCTNAYLIISFSKNNIQSLSGKKCNFRAGLSIQKSGIKLK